MKKRKALKKGLRLYEGKELSKDFPITAINASSVTVYPLSQHIGEPAEPLVNPGDRVLKGQMIAKAGGFISAPVHSSVSGTVKSIENRRVINGSLVKSIVVENDGLDEEVEGMGVKSNPDDLTIEEILQKIKDFGVIGLGGAGFPTGVKLSPKNADEIDTIIINGCECEPYLTVDYRIMLEKGEQIVKAVRQIQRLLPNAKAIFGIEDNKNDSIKVIKGFIQPDDNMDICELKTKYPQGGERSLIYAVTGRKINSKMLDGVNQCNNFKVPIGCSHQYVIEKCGGLKENVVKVISGGPMTGFAMSTLEVPVQKTSASILAFTEDDVASVEATNCIHCGRCVSVCPSNLLPQMLAKAVKQSKFTAFADLGGMECVQCGCCSYTCPARIPLTHLFDVGKAEVRKESNRQKSKEVN